MFFVEKHIQLKNIKGITIELNGDTTKLDKALKDVNKTFNKFIFLFFNYYYYL